MASCGNHGMLAGLANSYRQSKYRGHIRLTRPINHSGAQQPELHWEGPMNGKASVTYEELLVTSILVGLAILLSCLA